jgi:beta-mannosidase
VDRCSPIGHTPPPSPPTPQLFTHERIDLVCDGLDTIATIQLNGSEVAQTQNMHRGYRFDIKSLLRQGENTLTITFASPVRYAQRMREKLGRRPYVNGPGGPFNFIRKMACNFGWDWGPALVTSGIWKAVNLEGWSIARIDSITASVRHPTPQDFPSTLDGPDEGINPFTGQQYTPKDSLMFVDLHPRFEVTDSGRFRRPYHDRDNVAAELTIKLLDSTGADVTTISGIYGPGLDDIISVPVPNPQLWSPHGHGDQRRYVLDLQLISWGPDVKPGLLTRVFWRKNLPKSAGDSGRRTAGELLDEHSLRIGLRTIELDTSPTPSARALR